ncbi:MAG: sigma-70 family RNA polymerase sigma factor, partial [Clostridiales bacterium]|nr:sigma-70 family RNA polymerase sigma factor [Clostridiales bacterium]
TAEALDIRSALGKLDREEKKLIYLRYYNDITVRDIAQMLGIPKSTVQYKLKSAEKKLREQLKGNLS